MAIQQQPGLLSRILFFIIALLATAGFFVVGATVFLVLLGLAVIAFVSFSLRVWWLKRKLARQYGEGFQRQQADRDAFIRTQQYYSGNRASKNTIKGVIVEGEIVEPSDNNE